MPLSLTTAPASEPVSVAEFKSLLAYSGSDQDTMFASLLLAARQWAESHTWRQFITATYTLTLPDFRHTIYVPRCPLQSVTSIKYYDLTETQLTVSPDVYDVQVGTPALIRTNTVSGWPVVYDMPEPVEITFVAGYGDDSTDIPEPIRIAIQFLAQSWFSCGAGSPVPQTVKSLLSPYVNRDTRALGGL